MTVAGQTDKVEKLIAWLRKRGEPDSGIRYESNDGFGRARVVLHGPDATFIADHFHGQGARDLAAALTELQHRREAEVQCCMCGKAGLSTTEGDGGQECELNDGRWVCSGECWDRAASPSSPASGVRVKELEWKPVALVDGFNWLTVAQAETPFGRYTIDKHDKGFFRVMFGNRRVAHRDDKDAAYAAAQADYEARIRSALGEHP